MSGESRDLPHAAGAFDLFLGGLPQQTVASVDHRETPQQFDKMATADLYRDLLMPATEFTVSVLYRKDYSTGR